MQLIELLAILIPLTLLAASSCVMLFLNCSWRMSVLVSLMIIYLMSQLIFVLCGSRLSS